MRPPGMVSASTPVHVWFLCTPPRLTGVVLGAGPAAGHAASEAVKNERVVEGLRGYERAARGRTEGIRASSRCGLQTGTCSLPSNLTHVCCGADAFSPHAGVFCMIR